MALVRRYQSSLSELQPADNDAAGRDGRCSSQAAANDRRRRERERGSERVSKNVSGKKEGE